MLSRFTITKVVIGYLPILLFFLALLLPWSGWLGPVSPSPDRVVVFVNDEELQDIKQPVSIRKGKTVKVRVQAYYRGQPINPGEFTYQWCFDPPVNDNHFCAGDNYRGETNNDYTPENFDEQTLKITVQHDILKTSTVTILFKPE